MPWTKINYPDLMKKLSGGKRKKIVKRAKALLKENKKRIEEALLTIIVKHAKGKAAKSEKKTKTSLKKKTKVAAKKKIKTPVKKKTAKAQEKKIKTQAKKEVKSVVKKKTLKPAGEKIKRPVTQTPEPQTINPAEELHSTAVQEGVPPITTLQAHKIENGFHHREEVSFHQENQKVKQALATRKNSKRFFRTRRGM
jgi:uncharacterized protein YdaT